MAWIPVTLKAGGKTYGVRDRLDLSDDEFVMEGDNFIAFAIRRTNGQVSHYVWNPKRQPVSSLRKMFGAAVSQVPGPIRSGMQSTALSIIGGRLAGPAGRVAGIVASQVVPFEKLWQVLSVHEDKEIGYYEAESGERSTTFQQMVTIQDITLA